MNWQECIYKITLAICLSNECYHISILYIDFQVCLANYTLLKPKRH